MSDPEKNRGGRPRVPVPGYPVMTWLPKPDHERLMTISNRTGVSVSQIVKKLIARDVKPE